MNKKTLSCFPYPWLLSWIQIAVGAAFSLVCWKLKIFKAPEVAGLSARRSNAVDPDGLKARLG